MSKIQKSKKVKRKPTAPVKNQLESILQFSAWVFLFTLIFFLGIWILGDLLNIIEFEIEVVSYGFVVFTGTSSAFCFGTATLIKRNTEREKAFVLDWVVGMFLFSMIAIFLLAIYQF